MHIALLASDGRSPTEISRVLFCSRTTVYALASRFAGEGRAAFDELRQARGPEPSLGKEANERVEKLLEEDSPTDHGWLRSRWSCKLISLCSFSGSGPPQRAGRRSAAARCIGWSTAGGGRAPSRPRGTPRSRSRRRSARGSGMSCK